MATKKYALIRAKFSSQTLTGGRCKPGEWVVMFPRCNFSGMSQSGKKSFTNSYICLNDLSKFPEYKDIYDDIVKKYGINPDTYGRPTTTWRR